MRCCFFRPLGDRPESTGSTGIVPMSSSGVNTGPSWPCLYYSWFLMASLIPSKGL